MSETQAGVDTPSATEKAFENFSLEEAKKNLPTEVTTTFKKPGDLVNISDFTDEQLAKITEEAAKFNVRDTTETLRFGAATQERATSYLDELLGHMKVKDASEAGQILAEITTGVDMMKLGKVRDQLKNGRGLLGKVFWWTGAFTDYIKMFRANNSTVVSQFEKIETKAKNQVAMLSADSAKLDRLVGSTEVQIEELRVLIAVGEKILERVLQEYLEEREEVLSQDPIDNLKLSKLLDFKRSITAFEVRLLRLKNEYVKASTVVFETIRNTQQAIKIEIQNIDEAILFDMPDLKRAILQLGSLNNVQEAQKARAGYNKARNQINDILVDTSNAAQESAIQSQGDALRQAEELNALVNKMLEGAKNALAADREAAGHRAQAQELLVQIKQNSDEGLAEIARQSA